MLGGGGVTAGEEAPSPPPPRFALFICAGIKSSHKTRGVKGSYAGQERSLGGNAEFLPLSAVKWQPQTVCG